MMITVIWDVIQCRLIKWLCLAVILEFCMQHVIYRTQWVANCDINVYDAVFLFTG